MAVLYGRNGRSTAQNGGFRPGQSARGLFGDALAEVDWMVGNLVARLEALGLMEHTLFLFAGDNGPDMFKGQSGGSEGLFSGRFAGYWNTGKGSTWEVSRSSGSRGRAAARGGAHRRGQ
jgi:arylsulfatase A-like enzyme